ncbi:MAG: D-alanine--D-alanine ligase family protein [bacterium]
MKKTNLALLFGGRSCEHEVSVTSARSILNAIDREKYNVSLIGIDKLGHWHLAESFDRLIADGGVKSIGDDANTATECITLDLHAHGNLAPATTATPPKTTRATLPKIDVVFPALHGTFGEDGAIQGVFEMAGIPYVGCGVAASAVAMDKILAKKIFAAAGIPQAAHIEVTAAQWRAQPQAVIARAAREIAYPLFVKPANSGSSVGVGKVGGEDELADAINHALRFDNKIVIEQAMENCREIECAVLGNALSQSDANDGARSDAQGDANDGVRASVVGEIIPGAEFYDYATKYIDDKSELIVPADLPAAVAERVRELALRAFAEIDGAGLARVDFFVHRETFAVTLNEINTLPGFTPISMYPRLWAASGVRYDALIDRLIELALQSHHARAALQRALTT